ncbi:MAG: zinc ribbon domain-containing protein [Candidatus Abyssobacteria bacterium SURF_17]|uniref:Zinc ribbon domain-containing protein n=1 Tax=Candidatus Abyssobacteria bacterium SURF_17 TaxID=2093361 RepID=A0A419EZH4_9BACT|nr:MAG: zinc ribbon domain-containing protein [Candidatus Abyssubacteria bacterium SURF_17]
MPIYEFECGKCHHSFEALLRSSNAPFPPCEKCGNKRVRKCVSRFGFSSGGKTVSSLGTSGCGSCTSSNCSSCH